MTIKYYLLCDRYGKLRVKIRVRQIEKVRTRIPESGPNVPDSPDFLIKFYKPVRIPDRIFPYLLIKLWKPDSGFSIFAPDPGKILSGAGH
jgi:hypothetical protein